MLDTGSITYSYLPHTIDAGVTKHETRLFLLFFSIPILLGILRVDHVASSRGFPSHG